LRLITLPSPFIEKMKSLLGTQAELFLASYEQPRTHGLRLNPLKVRNPERADGLPDELQPLRPVPWCREGYYYEENVRPGKHPYHAAGVYYIQEPSAMSAVELLDPHPGDIVLDLAASPGGKATQIAGRLRGEGLLIANEIHPARVKALSENIERMGVTNAVVTNADPEALAGRFACFFDKIIVDAPCSGEGMFRKDPDAMMEWSPELVQMCARRQRDILDRAVRMLKPGGTLVYSTCTFSPEENEENVRWLTQRYPAFRLLRTERLWPHLHRGEGHFVALLQLADESGGGNAVQCAVDEDAHRDVPKRVGGRRRFAPAAASPPGKGGLAKPLAFAMQLFREFAADSLPGFALGPGEPVLFGEQLYWLPHAPGCPFGSGHLQGLKVARPGLHLGTIRNKRFVPAHALALAARADQARLSLRLETAEAAAYLKGESLAAPPGHGGWTLVTVDGYPLGWGKASGGQLKNHYPKGLRRLE